MSDPADTEVFDLAERVGVIPVVTLPDPALAAHVVKALVTGGLPIVELTLRTAAGLDAIRATAGVIERAVVGAGSVRSIEEAEAAAEAGAAFLVSPGLDDDVVHFADRRGIPLIPGVATATEVMRARSLGLDLVKFFPAEPAGGVAMLAAWAAVFPDMRFMPTGGIGPTNLATYLELDSVVAVGGSWIASAGALASGDWRAVTESAAAASESAARMRGTP